MNKGFLQGTHFYIESGDKIVRTYNHTGDAVEITLSNGAKFVCGTEQELFDFENKTVFACYSLAKKLHNGLVVEKIESIGKADLFDVSVMNEEHSFYISVGDVDIKVHNLNIGRYLWYTSGNPGGLAVGASSNYSYSSVSPVLNNSFWYLIKNDAQGVALSNITFSVRSGFSQMDNYNWVLSIPTDPVIQYSDDGTHWESVQTTRIGYESKTSQQSDEIGIGIYREDTYTLENSSDVSAHDYWRISFNSHLSLSAQSGANYNSDYNVIGFGIRECSFINANATRERAAYSDPAWTLDSLIKFGQYNKRIIFTQKNKKPYYMKYFAGTITHGDFVPEKPANLWESLGVPSSVCFYQNRLWFAGFEKYPTRVIGSRFLGTKTNIESLEDFDYSGDLTATAPVSADCVEFSSFIENLFGGNLALYALSTDGVAMIDAKNAIASSETLEFKLRNREPVGEMTPTVKDDIMMYLGFDKNKILVTDYDYVVQRFRAIDISKKYDNWISKGVKELHYIPRKNGYIYGLLETGDGFVVLFDQSTGLNSFYPLDTNGTIIDITPIKRNNSIKLLMVVERNGEYFLEEKLQQNDIEAMDFVDEITKTSYAYNTLHNSSPYLDCSIKKHFSSPTNSFEVPYKIGEKVVVIADGNYLPETEVVEMNGGAHIVLPTPASDVVCGIPYDSYAVLKMVSPYGTKKFVKEIAVNFINTGYLEVGNCFENMHPVLGNLADGANLFGNKILLNDNYVKTLDKSVEPTPYVIVRSSEGLPFTITGIDYKIDTSNYQGGI
jgi:hypothetical protein